MSERPISITITSGAILKAVGITALMAILFFLRDIVLIVLTAVVIASAIEPAVRSLCRRRIPRTISVILVYALLFGLFFSVFYFFVPSLFEEISSFVASLPSYIEALTHSGALNFYTGVFGFETPNVSAEGFLTGLREVFTGGGNAISAAGQVFGGLFSFVLILVFSFYFAVVETGVDDFLRIITPKRYHGYVYDLWKRSQHKIGLWMQGQLLLALIVGVLVFLLLTILGIPHALLLAAVAALLEIIPVFGPTLAAVPAVAIGAVTGGPSLAIIVVCVYIVVQLFENHLIYPLVVTRVVGVPPLLVILALIVGAELAGFLGVILSVPAAATLQELVRDIEAGRFPSQRTRA